MTTLGVDKVIIFVDELNKYAAAGSQNALRDTLVDIAARGRHLNVVLFGAQQFRSKVDDEILGNCGTSFYGRVGDEEITNASYRSLEREHEDGTARIAEGPSACPPCPFPRSAVRRLSAAAYRWPEPPGSGSSTPRAPNSRPARRKRYFKTLRSLSEFRITMAEVSNYCNGISGRQITEIIALI